ncbi:ABC transporter ATP-binding protein [Alkalicoccobacillus murimartini]|uniref:Peptide/nickel transport system ATP-binding protein n=1 Tax=Alkalicoccobacillus murimartini TaxID=171685 RepID=A0ABT9YHW0_9BACI|nr:ABC transporter ATP-binding protein [Alkalicoccobacillus murimartini]MDQ0207296.1 peptide/nickel transport system ATP-binding protein [Alkalicoccobacillus murimartini]
MKTLLEVRNLSIDFEQGELFTKAVSNVSFHIKKGETLGIVGESGSGKSVTARAIMKLLPHSAIYKPDTSIVFLGKDLSQATEKQMEKVRGRDIGMIFQDPMTSLNPTKTIGKQLTESIIKHQKLSSKQAKQEATNMMKLVGINNPEYRFKQYPHEFSGGMRQRIVIAIALACKPALLIADEPTTALDVTIQAQILELMKDIQKQTDTSIILITHDFGVVSQMCDRVIVMKEGAIVEENDVISIFKNPQNDYTKKLLHALPDLQDQKPVKVIDTQKQELLRVSHLKQYFTLAKGQVTKAVDDISFSIMKGETLGFVGESGSGKSTTGRTILHLHRPTSGEVIYEGFDLAHLTPSELKQMRQHMQIIFQDPFASLNPRLKVIDIIGEALDIHHLAQSKAERQARVEELLKMVGLDPAFAIRYPHEFSGGQRQRIGIARALAVDPTFIVCDETLSALDASIQAQIVDLLEDLQKKLNLTYLFIAHDLSMVKRICDRVAVMFNGKIVEMADTEELYSNPLHPYTQNLLAAIPVPDPTITSTQQVKSISVPEDWEDHQLIEVQKGHWVAQVG